MVTVLVVMADFSSDLVFFYSKLEPFKYRTFKKFLLVNVLNHLRLFERLLLSVQKLDHQRLF